MSISFLLIIGVLIGILAIWAYNTRLPPGSSALIDGQDAKIFNIACRGRIPWWKSTRYMPWLWVSRDDIKFNTPLFQRVTINFTDIEKIIHSKSPFYGTTRVDLFTKSKKRYFFIFLSPEEGPVFVQILVDHDITVESTDKTYF